MPCARNPLRHAAEGADAAARQLLPAGQPAGWPLPVSFQLGAGVVQRQGLFLPVHSRRGRRPHETVARGGLERRRLRWPPQEAARRRTLSGLPPLLQGGVVAAARCDAEGETMPCARRVPSRSPWSADTITCPNPASFSSIRPSSAASRSHGRDAARNAKRCSALRSRPYSLLVIAALLREKGIQIRLVDLTAEAAHRPNR